MGLLDRLFGRNQQQNPHPTGSQAGAPASFPTGAPAHRQPAPQQPGAGAAGPASGQQLTDQQAVQRYEYLLRTAPPEQIEQAHTEAFAKLTPQQRQQVLAKLAQVNPQEAPRDDSPQALARSATRIEMHRPGTLRGAFGGGGMGMGMGMGGMLLTSIAGAFVGTAIADAMFDMNDGAFADGGDAGDAGDAGDGDLSGEAPVDGADGGDALADGGDLSGSADVDSMGWGGFEDSGSGFGDLGGGDFGGGDFGGDF